MIQGLFFDLDGTLVNTYEADFRAYRDAIADVAGITVTADDFAATHGMEMADKLKRLVPDLTDDRYPAVRAAKKKYYPGYLELTVPNRALLDFIVHFQPDLQCVLVTTAKRDNVAAVLAHHGLNDVFQVVVCGDDVANAKPHPEPYLLALERSGLAAGQVIAFEDSPSGIASAAAAGISVLPVRSFA